MTVSKQRNNTAETFEALPLSCAGLPQAGTCPSSELEQANTQLEGFVRSGTRGRPAIAHDNRRVRAYLSGFATLSEVTEMHPSMDDVFVGVSRLQTEGQRSTRPLSRRTLFHILSVCDTITTATVAEAMGSAPDDRHARRYAGHARVASQAIARLLEQRPWLEAALNVWSPAGARQSILEAQAELDEPYFAELREAGLM